MPEGHDATIEVCNIMSFVLYTQILKQSVLKPASPGITLRIFHTLSSDLPLMRFFFISPQQKISSLHTFSETVSEFEVFSKRITC